MRDPLSLRRAGFARHKQVTQGVYGLLLKHGLHYKPGETEENNILAGATSQGATEADFELSKQNMHACVRARSPAPCFGAAGPHTRAPILLPRW